MERRKFLASTLTASAAAAVGTAEFLGSTPALAQSGDAREFYQLRCYHFVNGPQRKMADDFFRDALIPALNRLGIGPVGVFSIAIGPETPSTYVLMPCASLETLALVEFRLAKDAEYFKAGAAFLSAPATTPSFVRMESSLMQAFACMPKLVLPPAAKTKSARVFELRTYESGTDRDHKTKVEMMQVEGAVFVKAGFEQVFYGDVLVGARQPCLTYMISYESLAERDKKWGTFISSPEWKTLSGDPRYSFEEIVSNITNLMLTPAQYSQI